MGLADWNARLLSPQRGLELAGDWPLTATRELAALSQYESEGGGAGQADQWQINLRCAQDGQSCGLLADEGGPFTTSIGDLLSGVLRHLVTAHDLRLNTARPSRRRET